MHWVLGFVTLLSQFDVLGFVTSLSQSNALGVGLCDVSFGVSCVNTLNYMMQICQ